MIAALVALSVVIVALLIDRHATANERAAVDAEHRSERHRLVDQVINLSVSRTAQEHAYVDWRSRMEPPASNGTPPREREAYAPLVGE